MKKLLALGLTLTMALSLSACGDKAKDEKAKDEKSSTAAVVENKFSGEWIGVGGDAWGMTFTAEDAAAYTLSVEDAGKAILTTDGEELETVYEIDGDKIKLEVEALEMSSEGVLENGAIYFEDLMGLGINIYFAKEGTDAADPSLYIPEADKAMVGTWKSYAVADILDEDASGEISPEALTLTFKGDYTVDVEYNGEVTENQQWTLYENFGYLADSTLDISWDVEGDEIVVTCNMDDYYNFSCKKQ